MGLLDDSGSLQTDFRKMQQIATGFFKNLFTAQESIQMISSQPSRFPTMSTSALTFLNSSVTPNEIYCSLFQIGKYKAPGYDGFPAAFFQDHWKICAPDIIQYITSIFENAAIPTGLNHTLIALVPKISSPQEMKDFRPISLCCTIYKVISKIIVSRLRPLLPSWISPNQVSYVPGRHITDNILITQELIHKFRYSSGRKGYMAWKIDLSKAYDKLSWEFIHSVLNDLQIPQKLTQLILSCVSSTSFQVLINGELSDTFSGNRGIRQGDPLSPYLFVLCMEKLSHLIHDEVDSGMWKPVKATRFGPSISHLFFADDLILFAEANSTQARILKNSMDIFCNATGQSVNFDKSAIYCSANFSSSVASNISSICGSPLTDDLGKYLGMPILHSRVGKNTYANLADKALSRLAGWKSKVLNIAGRMTLIQSVTSAIPVYAMQTSKLPISTCEKLDSINRAFLWGDTADKKKIHLVNWTAVCRPKSLGGLGLKKTKDMNQAMLAKAGWRIFQNDQGLWSQIFKNKYLVNSSFPQGYQKPAACSHSWSSIVHGSLLLKKGLRWRIGNGCKVFFWTDEWTNFGVLAEHSLIDPITEINSRVCDLWINKCWNVSRLTQLLPAHIVHHICAIPISHSHEEDKLIWGAAPNGIFSVNSAYSLQFANQNSTVYPWFRNWKLPIPPKLKVFIWTVVAQKLLTNPQRMIRHFTSDPSCFHCPGTPESLLHLFRDCPKARLVWNSFYIPPLMAASFDLDWNDWLYANLLQSKYFHLNIPWNSFFCFICWHIWKWRCNCIFDNRFNLPFDMKAIISSYIVDWISASTRTVINRPMQTLMLCWIKPPNGSMKINVDGSLSCGGSIGAGGIMRDSSGSWNGGFSINLGNGSILQAEAWALYYGMLLALRNNLQRVEFESDSTTLINLLNDDAVSMHPLGTIFTNCKTLAENFSSCSVRHIHRERNKAADFLAKSSLDNDQSIIWLDTSPMALTDILHDDAAGTVKARRVHYLSDDQRIYYGQSDIHAGSSGLCWTNRNTRGEPVVMTGREDHSEEISAYAMDASPQVQMESLNLNDVMHDHLENANMEIAVATPRSGIGTSFPVTLATEDDITLGRQCAPMCNGCLASKQPPHG